MESLIFLSLRIISFLTIVWATPPNISAENDIVSGLQAPQLSTPMSNDLYESGGIFPVADEGDPVEELEDLPIISSEPTEYPLDFRGPKSIKLMSFGEAVILAREEAKCFDTYGSQKTDNTVLGSNTGTLLAERLVIPFGCYKTETTAQCEQCKNFTSQPMKSLDECQRVCDHLDTSCNSSCSNVYQMLRNESKFYDRAHNRRESSNAVMGSTYLEDTERVVNITGSLYNMSTDGNMSNSSKIPEDFLQSVVQISERRVIQLPQVFCEGVNYLEESKGGQLQKTSSFTTSSGAHFVLLKWNVHETRTGFNGSRQPDLALGHSNVGLKGKDDTTQTTRHEQIPLIFVIEQKTKNASEWKTIGKTPYGLQTVNVSYRSNTYKWRITAVGPKGIESVATTSEYVTLDGYQTPGPPKKIYVVQTEVNQSSVNVLIGWDPPDDKACFYKIVLEGSSGKKTDTVRIKDPLGFHMHWFQGLAFGTIYHVRMTTRNPNWRYESNLTKLEFKTPTCLESFHFRFDKCAPTPPRDIKAEVETIKGQPTDQQQQVQIVLTWLPPLNASKWNTVEKYVVEISTFNLHRASIPKLNFTGVSKDTLLATELTKNFTVSGNITKLTLKNLRTDTEYTVMIAAYSTRGPSPRAQYHFNTRIAVKSELSQQRVGNWLYITVAFTLAAVMILVCNAVRIYVHKRNVKIARNQYFQSMEERDEMGPDWSIVPLTEDPSNWKLFDENFPKEKWEIAWDQMTMGEVIGQGAFGVVRRAKIQKKKLEAKLKFRGEDETWFNSADRNVDEDPEMDTVAVKMVKVSSTRDDREQLIKEITMMQSLGFHSQIVGLLGACTKGRTLCLVLEYCPGGDLLTFVRKVRAKYWPTLGLSGSRMQTSPCTGSRNVKTSTAGMQFCGRTTNSGSGGTGPMSSVSSENRKSSDSSPINYADIGGFSESCSSPETSLPRFNGSQNFKMDCVGNSQSAKTDDSVPPFFTDGNDEFKEDDEFRPIDEKDVLSYARQIAMGMEYLEKNRVVHRDLACRNVLLMGDYKHVKISDFGLSRDIYTWNVYHQKSNGKLPIKWMAIESIFTHVFTTKSDVWSYGILLWELVTLGGTPYPGLGNTELFHLLKSGYRMERPDNCSEELYAVMKKCWRTAAASRPSFTELRRHIETMMEAAEPNLYLSLMADLPADYFQLSSRSDIPLVGKEDVISPLKDSPMGIPNIFPSRSNNHFGFDNPGPSSRSRGTGTSHHHSRRKTRSVYHNARYKNTMPESPTASADEEDFLEDGQSCLSSSSQRKDRKFNDHQQRRKSFSLICTSLSNTGPFSTEFVGHDSTTNEITSNRETSITHQDGDNSSCIPNSSTSSHKVRREKVPQKLSLDFQGDRTNASEKVHQGLLSPDSGILIQRGGELATQCDSDHGSSIDEVDNNPGGQGDNDLACGEESSSQLSKADGKVEEGELPSTSSNITKRSQERNSSTRKGYRGRRDAGPNARAEIGKRPKLTLPFVNVNDMTIIENRSYDIRD
ncbi:unnamed protein product [Orchesella dallaii]|uniref:receptor protein-tyrosine kinase n=1 Tax=Orchesella dallaii TaxID=48710 RepID=A0ABP1Q4H8_9HEXA